MSLEDSFNLAVDTAKQVGKRIREELESGSFEVKHKGRFDMVTEIDLWAENEITKAVSSNFPEHLVIGEETSDELAKKEGKSLEEICSSGIRWIVDPIDGTTNFINRVPHVAVSIGIMKDGKREMAVAYDPCRDEMFTAKRGEGAFLNGSKIEPSKKEKLEHSVVATGFPYKRKDEVEYLARLMKEFILSFRSARAFGSAVIDQCWIACGRHDVFMEYHLKPWDVCAGSLIVEESGAFAANFAQGLKNPFSIFNTSFLYVGESIKADVLNFLTETGLAK